MASSSRADGGGAAGELARFSHSKKWIGMPCAMALSWYFVGLRPAIEATSTVAWRERRLASAASSPCSQAAYSA